MKGLKGMLKHVEEKEKQEMTKSTTLQEIRQKLQAMNQQKPEINWAGEPMHDEFDEYKVLKRLKDEPLLPVATGNVSLYQNLKCPNCEESDSYLHHIGVEFFARNEDAEKGEHISLVGANVWGRVHDANEVDIQVDGNMNNNKSGRRGSVVIHFQCEICGQKPQLHFIQHKGMTYTGWL